MRGLAEAVYDNEGEFLQAVPEFMAWCRDNAAAIRRRTAPGGGTDWVSCTYRVPSKDGTYLAVGVAATCGHDGLVWTAYADDGLRYYPDADGNIGHHSRTFDKAPCKRDFDEALAALRAQGQAGQSIKEKHH
jgi:hypothetical protein